VRAQHSKPRRAIHGELFLLNSNTLEDRVKAPADAISAQLKVRFQDRGLIRLRAPQGAGGDAR